MQAGSTALPACSCGVQSWSACKKYMQGEVNDASHGGQPGLGQTTCREVRGQQGQRRRWREECKAARGGGWRGVVGR